MEIKLREGTYVINPQRIICIKYYRFPPPNNGKYSEVEEFYRRNNLTIDSSELEEEEDKDFLHMIEIHFTDGENLTFSIDNKKEYESFRDELKRVVGG